MELIETEAEKQPDVLPEPEPRYHTASLPERTEHGQAWLRLALSILAAIILVVVVVILARWIYHAAHNNAQTPPAVTLKSPASSSNKSTSGAQSTPANPTPAPTSSSNTNNNNGANPQITNTGPGNVAAIFIGTSLAAAGLHYLISLRRANQQ